MSPKRALAHVVARVPTATVVLLIGTTVAWVAWGFYQSWVATLIALGVLALVVLVGVGLSQAIEWAQDYLDRP